MSSFCPECGTKLNPKDMFCGECGAPIDEVESPQDPEEVEPLKPEEAKPPLEQKEESKPQPPPKPVYDAKTSSDKVIFIVAGIVLVLIIAAGAAFYSIVKDGGSLSDMGERLKSLITSSTGQPSGKSPPSNGKIAPKPKPAWLGIHITTVDKDIAESLGAGANPGALVAKLSPGGPAEKAGIRAGDLIQGFNGKKIPNPEVLTREAARVRAGQKVTLTVFRRGKLTSITFSAGSR